MKKRLLCLVLALCMGLGLVCSGAEEIELSEFDEEIVVSEVFEQDLMPQDDGDPTGDEVVLTEEIVTEDAPDGADTPEDAIPGDSDTVAPEKATEAEDAIPDEPAELTGLTGPGSAMSIGVGEKVCLNILPEPSNALCELTYSTSNKKYVTVDAGGVICGKRKGSATITARADDDHVLKIKVTVKYAPGKVTLKPGKTKLGVGEVAALKVSYPKEQTSYARTFTVSDESVLRITPEGKLLAAGPGKAKVTVTTYNSKHKSAWVTVLPAPEYLIPSVNRLTFAPGMSGAFKASLPEGTLGTIIYESDAPDVATVDPASGRIKAVSVGSARIRAVAHNGVETGCDVTVLPPPEAMALEEQETGVTLPVGEKWTPEPAMSPEDSYPGVTLKSSNAKVAAVSNGSIVGRKGGKATVTVKSCNGLTATVKVTVLPAPTSVSFAPGYAHIGVGETIALNVRLTKGSTTRLTFESLNPDIASIDPETGEVTGLRQGSAVIGVHTLNKLSAYCLVNVATGMDPDAIVNGDFKITFMCIGRNDGILIECGGEYAFIDSGIHDYGVKAVNYMKARGVTHLKYYIASHSHKDHVGGAAYILSRIPTDIVLLPRNNTRELIADWAESSAERKAAAAARYHVLSADEVFYIGGARCDVLAPRRIRSSSWRKQSENANSLILKVNYGSTGFLLTGDATEEEFEDVRKARPGVLHANVYKNPHHNADLYDPVRYCDPDVLVFSTSRSSHPDTRHLKWVLGRGIAVYNTASNKDGHVTVISNGSELSVQTSN